MLGTRDGRWWLRWWLTERRWVVAVLLLAGVLALMGAIALVVTAATAGSVVGLKAKAIALAIYESSVTGQVVRVEDVLSGAAREYQRPMDERWGP